MKSSRPKLEVKMPWLVYVKKKLEWVDANIICWLMEANGESNTLSYLEICPDVPLDFHHPLYFHLPLNQVAVKS